MNAINPVSANNTPQAKDDVYAFTELGIETAGGHIHWLDVMANDLGGKAKTLYSIDNGDNLADLFQQDAQVTFESSSLGAHIYIQDGKIAYDTSTLAAQIDGLGAGETLTDTLTYSIRLGNGTLSLGEVKITITGSNDAAEITGDSQAEITEDESPNTVSGNLDATDVDGPDDSFVAVASPAASAAGYGTYTVDATGHWTYALDNDNAAVNALNDSDTLSDSFTVQTADGTSQVVTITIHGNSEGLILPEVFQGADPNDGDSLVGTPPGPRSGTDDPDVITGTANADIINGYEGDDQIDASHGPDTVYGGAGNDTIVGNVGLDVLYGQGGDDQISGSQNIDRIYGGSGNDVIDGGTEVDEIYGGSGDDTMTGAGAADVLVGGFGADSLTGAGLVGMQDIFRYLDTKDTGDTITDFASGKDLIDFAAIDADDSIGGDQAFIYGGTNATAHGLWYATDASGNAAVYLDTDGDIGTAELAITLNNVAALSAGDFIL